MVHFHQLYLPASVYTLSADDGNKYGPAIGCADVEAVLPFVITCSSMRVCPYVGRETLQDNTTLDCQQAAALPGIVVAGSPVRFLPTFHHRRSLCRCDMRCSPSIPLVYVAVRVPVCTCQWWLCAPAVAVLNLIGSPASARLLPSALLNSEPGPWRGSCPLSS
jgi:hypothetical protein